MSRDRSAVAGKIPSVTSEGKEWIGNFSSEDQATAAMLINSLRVFSGDDFRSRLHKMILDFLPQLRSPVAIYPVRRSKEGAQEPSQPEVNKRLPGSFAVVANIIRDVVRNPSNEVFVKAIPTLTELREHRIRSVLLVDDYSGSGDLSIGHGRAWSRNPTIRSWRSYGLIGLHYASFAVSSLAAKNIKRAGVFDSVFNVECGLDFSSARWTPEERDAIEDLCRTYSWNYSYAFGRGGSRGLCVMPHTVPNNLPAILWQKKGLYGRPWIPLFGARIMTPRQQAELAGYGPHVDVAQIASQIGQRRLARQLHERLRDESADFKRLLVLLGSLAVGKRRDQALSIKLNLPIGALIEMLEVGRQLGLVDDKRRLTDAGWAELRAARKQPRGSAWELTGSDDDYYPSKLRGSQ